MVRREMNSGNSGSLQSSSGGDDEYDSRVRQDSFSAFFNPTNQPPSHHHQNQPNSSNYLVDSPNLDTTTTTTAWLWNNLRRSEPNCTEMINPFLVSTSSSSFVSSSSTVPFPRASSSLLSSTTVALHNPPKKKRNRASRRAPTTVMTTDTTNFRAMVQEFTGIPTSTNFPAPTTTLDLYPTPSIIRSNLSSQQYSSFSSSSSQLLPPYLLRPFPQRLQQPQPQPQPSNQLGLLDMLQSHPPQGSYGLKMGDQYFGN